MKSPLSAYEVKFNKPRRWETLIADIQSEYIEDTYSGEVRLFDATVSYLKTLAISEQVFQPDQQEELELLAFSALNLENLYLLFHDTEVTEVFSNSIGSDIIITHMTHGRCRTNLKFTKDMWQALKIRAEYDTGRPLNSSNPAMKVGLSSNMGNLRISLQVPPLSTLGPTLSIRRLPASALNLEQLLDQEQVTPEVSSLLVSAVQSRENIVIAGEPGSGKTTLANALLQTVDKSWRLIVVEDAKEISLSTTQFPLLVQYNMPAVGSSNRYTQRTNEIARLLHRSPDYVFLGEIQNRDDTTVAFEGFAAGIRGMATTHARNIQGLLMRWQFSHQLPKDLTSSIDWIVVTRREIKNGRFQFGIKGIYKEYGGRFHAEYEY